MLRQVRKLILFIAIEFPTRRWLLLPPGWRRAMQQTVFRMVLDGFVKHQPRYGSPHSFVVVILRIEFGFNMQIMHEVSEDRNNK